MKHLILSVLFLFIADLSFAQESVIYRCKSKEECIEFSKEFIKHTQKEYELESADEHFEYYSIIYSQKDKNEKPLYINIRYLPIVIGANLALEIEGETIYVFRSILGRYLDIFPIWKEFFDSEADLVETSTQKAVFAEIDVINEIKYKYVYKPLDEKKTSWLIKHTRLQ